MACLFVFAAQGARADGSLKDGPMPPLPEPAGRCSNGVFSGAYIGLQTGFGSLRSKVSGDTGSLSDNDRGFTIGEHSGYNIQCDDTLFGIESDFSYFGAENNMDCGGCGEDGQSFKSELNWFSTVRGRLGYVGFENTLLFVTAGLAYANVDHTFTDFDEEFSQKNSDTRFGWTAGGGVEFLRDANWTFRADALYVDLGTENRTYTTDGCDGPCTATASWNDTFWVARLGLTYHFHRPEVVDYAPMK